MAATRPSTSLKPIVSEKVHELLAQFSQKISSTKKADDCLQDATITSLAQEIYSQMKTDLNKVPNWECEEDKNLFHYFSQLNNEHIGCLLAFLESVKDQSMKRLENIETEIAASPSSPTP